MKNGMRKFLALMLIVCMALAPLGQASLKAEAADINNIGNPSYQLATNMAGDEVFVYAYNVRDYGADNTGNNDCTYIFQRLLNKVGDLGGGIVYAPKGRYKISGALSIPKGVTLRGDWQEPDKRKALPEGTLLMAYQGRNKGESDTPFIEMCVETGLMDIAIWYPEQDPNNIVPYSPTIRYGFNNYFGNEYSNTNHVTLVNSYIGIWYNINNFGAAPIVNNVYGTTLKKGVEIDKIADVGRIDGVNFSPDYWINSGLSNAPANKEAFKNYMKANSIGIVMRRNDWSYTCNVTVDGYYSAYNAEVSVGTDETPNGHHYNFNISDCTNGIMINCTNGVGILFDEINIKNCENGIVLSGNTGDVVQFTQTSIDASKYAIRTDAGSSTKFLLNNSKIERGQVSFNGGTLTANAVAFNNLQPQIYFGIAGRGIITGCSFKNGRQISNNSTYETTISDEVSNVSELASFPDAPFEPHTPSRRVLYNAALSPYNASTSAYDNTSAIQNALNQASRDGGGIVYLPSGKYKVRGHLTIPSNVELRGAVDVQTVPHGSGTILEAYEGRGNENGTPFIVLQANAGMRAVVVDYPEQVFVESNTWVPAAYPYTIQGQGDNVYVINSSVRASYKALDLFTYKCNNHYIDFLSGHAFNVGVKVGNGCTNGKLYNIMFNTIIYGCGNESKFGSFSNMPNGVSNQRVGAYSLDYLDFMVLGDCTNEILYNDFHYGSRHGLVLINEGKGGPSGVAMGLGIDGSARSVLVGAGTTGTFDLYNTQIVSIVGSNAADTSYYQIENGANMKLNTYNSDYWGQPNVGVQDGNNNSVLSLTGAHFNNPGQTVFASSTGGDIKIIGSNLNQNGTGFVATGSENNISVYGSTVNNRDNATSSFASWKSNQGLGATMSATGAVSTVNRNGWTASSSNNNNNARNALDGNINTRWDTAGAQVPGQWFQVDFGTTYRFNTLILDLGASTGDAPAGYEVYATNNPNSLGAPIASGSGTSIISFNTQNTRYVVIKQTGNRGNYWSIHEFYALDASAGNDLPNGEVAGGTVTPDPEPETQPETQPETKPDYSVTLDRTGWSASASKNTNAAKNAIDGAAATRWDTSSYMTGNEWFQVDLGSAKFFDTAVLDVAGSPNDWARGYEFYVSLDGTNWGSPVLTGGGTKVEEFNLGMQYARYVRVVQTGTSTANYWSIHEFNLKDSKGTTEYNVAYVDGGKVIAMESYSAGSAPRGFMAAPNADNKIFAGWYTKSVNLNSAQAVSSAAGSAGNISNVRNDAAFYAGWLEIGTNDKSFELLGTQIRIDNPSGLRFITQIGTGLVSEIEALNSANKALQPDSDSDKGIGFGTVVSKAAYVGSKELVKDVNATQVNKGMVVSPAVNLFEKTDAYYQYTSVVRGIGVTNFKTDIAARPYITYKDANGVERTYYYTESGTNVGGGYSVSLYKAAQAVYNGQSVSSTTKNWIYENILSKAN